jgi:hypothetical protein
MSRTGALWTAGVVTLILVMLIGAVMLRPVLEAGADNQPGIATSSQDGSAPAESWEDDWEEEDDGYWKDEDESDHEDGDSDEREDHEEDEGEDHDD